MFFRGGGKGGKSKVKDLTADFAYYDPACYDHGQKRPVKKSISPFFKGLMLFGTLCWIFSFFRTIQTMVQSIRRS
jgi:hypothetical protein